jgi:DNA polymerase-1
MAKKTLYLIDGHGFIFRAFHALPPLTRNDGTPVGAVLGFCNILMRVLDEAEGELIGVVFDPSGGNFRHEIYPEYKANRSAPPEDLIPQFSIVREAVEAFGLVALEKKGFEADDLIATYTREAVERNMDVRIISSDKDLMQLIRDGVRLIDPIKFSTIGPEQVMEKFGVIPEKVVDIQALAGDSTDNVPGVPGIGVKTAAELINTFGDLDTLLASTAQIKQPKRREVLESHAEMARISRRLVQLDDHAPLPKEFDELCSHTPDLQRLMPFLQFNGFRSLSSRVEKKWDGISAPYIPVEEKPVETPAAPTNTKRDYELVITEQDLDRWIKLIKDAGHVSIDTETNHLTPTRADMVGISMAVHAGHACYIPVGHKKGTDLFSETAGREFQQLDKKLVLQKLKPVLEDKSILKIGQNIKYDWQVFAKDGVILDPIEDTMVISYVLDSGKNGHGLDELSQIHLGQQLIAYTDVAGKGKNQKTFDIMLPEEIREYASEDADMCLQLYDRLFPRLVSEKRTQLYQEVDKPCVRLLAEMEFKGITVDPKVLKRLSADFDTKIQAAEKSVFKQAGQEFNLASPKQLGDVLFGNLGIPGGSKTKTGAWSTDAKTLEDVAAQGHAIVDDILQYRQLSKLKSTYTDALQEEINPATGRVHTSYALTLTNTGRLSSSDPNLQNIPIRTEEGRSIRTAFVAAPGHKLISADYSQIELRLIADMAGIPRLQQAFHDNIDIHTMTAAEVLGVPLDQVTSESRRAAKAINFGIIYGISGFGLARQLRTDNSTAIAYIKKYMQRFPELAEYMDKTKKFAKAHGYVETLMGRQIFMPGILSKNGAERGFAERQAINAPIQGTAADIMKMAMSAVDRALKKNKLPADILLQVHDELVVEAKTEAIDEVGKTIKQAMESVFKLNVPLVVEWGAGDNWNEAH